MQACRGKLPGLLLAGALEMQRMIEWFCADESGATAIEYALIGVLVAVAILVGATSLGGALNAQFVNIASSVSNAIAP